MRNNFQYYDSSSMFHGALQYVMGTRFDAVVIGLSKTESESVWIQMEKELKRLDKMLNRFDTESEISFVNENAYFRPVSVSAELWEILNKCGVYTQKTDGLFDITLNDFNKVVLDKSNLSVTFLQSDVSLDLGAYAKGFALGKLQDILVESNVNQALVNFGNSSILAIGHHPYGDSWKVSFENPYQKDVILGEISLNNNSLSTSGNTPAYSEHIIHPRSGKRIGQRRMVCVVTKYPEEAEVLSTTLMLVEKEETEMVLKQFDVEHVEIYDLS